MIIINSMDWIHMTPCEQHLTAYVAPKGFCDILQEEVRRAGQRIVDVRDPVVLVEGESFAPVWAQNIWFTPQFIPVASISDAARKLVNIQRNWSLTPTGQHRRAALIAEKLPYVSAKPLTFGQAVPSAALGHWTLWEPGLVLASPVCSSPFAEGMVNFIENKSEPPSRAYLKLWELFTLMPEAQPAPGDVCLDMGACPGGWTWVLAQGGARVFAVDKAPLAKHVEALPNVTFCQGSGFGLDPRHVGAVDWFFSDMICYPERLFELVQRWRELGACTRFVCTIKCQGETNHESIELFRAIPSSRIMHLSCNKHELTWVHLG